MKIYLGYGYSSWTTAVYFERAFSHFGEVVYVGTEKRDQAEAVADPGLMDPLSGAGIEDIFIYFDSGIPFFPKDIERLPVLTCCYLIDVHIGLDMRLEMAKFFDVVFLAQKDYVDHFKKRGIRNVFWIPLGCDPDIYQRLDCPPLHEIGFVGHVAKDNARRRRLLSLLGSRFRLNDFSRFYSPTESSFVYNSSKIVFNCSAKGDLNMRVFEALSCGRLLLTDAIDNGLCDLFRDRQHLVVYRSEADLLDLAAYYLSHDEKRIAIARQGGDLARERHTYKDRCRSMLDIAKKVSGEDHHASGSLRGSSREAVALARCKIYGHWGLLMNVTQECRGARSVAGYLVKIRLLARFLLARFFKK